MILYIPPLRKKIHTVKTALTIKCMPIDLNKKKYQRFDFFYILLIKRRMHIVRQLTMHIIVVQYHHFRALVFIYFIVDILK